MGMPSLYVTPPCEACPHQSKCVRARVACYDYFRYCSPSSPDVSLRYRSPEERRAPNRKYYEMVFKTGDEK